MNMRDFYYKLEPGNGPSMDDHLNALDSYVKSPIILAFDILTEAVDVSGQKADEINNCLLTIQGALITWEKIDAQMLADSVKANAATT